MAYLAASLDRDPFAPELVGDLAMAPQSSFTPLEWRVIDVAARDGLASLRRPGRLGSALRAMFGTRVASPLADPRLEQLRRAAVRYWRTGAAIEQAQVEALVAAGYSLPQVALLSRYIGARRTAA